jgi:hypothetical protein
MIWILCLGVLSLIVIISGFLPVLVDSVKTNCPPVILNFAEICQGICLVYWLIWIATDIRILGFPVFFFVLLISIISALSYPFMLRFMSIRIKDKRLSYLSSQSINIFLLIGLIPIFRYNLVCQILNPVMGFEGQLIV